MLEYIKQWLARRRGGTVGDHDAANLPSPKTVGDQPLSRSRLIVLDLETTGLNASKDEVIAIGAVAIAARYFFNNDSWALVIEGECIAGA